MLSRFTRDLSDGARALATAGVVVELVRVMSAVSRGIDVDSSASGTTSVTGSVGGVGVAGAPTGEAHPRTSEEQEGGRVRMRKQVRHGEEEKWKDTQSDEKRDTQ